MTREEKILKKKLRAKRRKEKHFAKYVEKIQVAKSIGDYGIPLHCVKQGRLFGSWADSDSPTGFSQVCSNSGICQSPCNGDC